MSVAECRACIFCSYFCCIVVYIVDLALLQIRDRLPHLKAIVQYKGKLSQQYPNVHEV